MEAVWGGGKERKRGGCTLAKRNAHWWSRTFIPMVCTKQMMCVWGNHPLHLLTCIDMHILLLVDLALMEAMWYKLHFNNTTALWKNLIYQVIKKLITLHGGVIIQNACHLWRLSFNMKPELIFNGVPSFHEANMPYLVKRSSTSTIRHLISLWLWKASN